MGYILAIWEQIPFDQFP